MMMPTRFGIPPKQKRKKKGAVDDASPCARSPAVPDYLDLQIETGEDGAILGVHGETVYAILDPAKVAPGEVWNCAIGNTRGPISRREAIPVTLVSKAEVIDEPEPEAEEETPETTADVSGYLREIEALKAKLAETEDRLKEKNGKLSLANLKIGRLEKQNGSISKIKEDNRRLSESNFSLKTQVSVLEKKSSEKEIQNITSERDRYKDMYEAQEKIIDGLRETIRMYEAGGRNNHQAVTTYLTGPTGIHCNLLDDGNYKVYFSPGRKTLRLIPDDCGMVECRSRDIVLPAIAGFTSFEKIRPLGATSDGDVVTITLG